MPKLTELIAPSFYEIHRDIKENKHTHYWEKGGRGSTKSSFFSVEIILGMMQNPDANAIAIRKVGMYLKDSVYEQLVWAIDKLGVSEYWQQKLSPLELIYLPTGQRILFRGADKPKKIKSTKVHKGYIRYIWYEEVDEFNGMAEIRTINQSLMRGGSKFNVFYSYNPPASQRNWVNEEVLTEREDRLVHHSTYLDVPPEWLGEQFIIEAEHLKNTKPELYAHEYMGEVTGTGGEVFTNIDIRAIADSEVKTFDKIRRGIDFGYAVDPFVYIVCHYDNKLFGVHYYQKQNLDGTMGNYMVQVADAVNKYEWTGSTIDSLRLVSAPKAHYFGIVPFVEYLNNDEAQGDFEQEISLIDAYNTLMSDRLNDKEQFVDSFLLLLGIDIDSDQAKKLKEEKILIGEIGGSAEYLNRVLDEADTEVLRNAIKEDIHKLSMVPDLTDEEFASNMSGVAIKYKLLGFEQLIKDKERLFKKGLNERLEIYIKILSFKSAMKEVPIHRIDVEFHRNLPSNELEISQMISNLTGLVSDETLLSRVPFVTDAKEEAKLVVKERQRKQSEAMKSIGDYKGPIKASEDDEE